MDGRSQRRIGRFLRGKNREDYQIQNALRARTAPVVFSELELGLARLECDEVNVCLLDSCLTVGVDDQVEYPELDAFDALLKAKEQGKAQKVGVRSSKDTSCVERLIQQFGQQIDLVQFSPKVTADNLAVQAALKHDIPIVVGADNQEQGLWFKGESKGLLGADFVSSRLLAFGNPDHLGNVLKRARKLSV